MWASRSAAGSARWWDCGWVGGSVRLWGCAMGHAFGGLVDEWVGGCGWACGWACEYACEWVASSVGAGSVCGSSSSLFWPGSGAGVQRAVLQLRLRADRSTTMSMGGAVGRSRPSREDGGCRGGPAPADAEAFVPWSPFEPQQLGLSGQVPNM